MRHGARRFTTASRHFPSIASGWHAPCNNKALASSEYRMHVYLADRSSVDAAQELMATFGDDAGFEAAARADKSRDLGNHVNFCRWRQIERLIVLMSQGRAVGTVH
jgi:hypothetical protein